MEAPSTECTDGDGGCPDSCAAADDGDCAAPDDPGGGDPDPADPAGSGDLIGTGCRTTGGSPGAPWLLALAALGLGLRRRR